MIEEYACHNGHADLPVSHRAVKVGRDVEAEVTFKCLPYLTPNNGIRDIAHVASGTPQGVHRPFERNSSDLMDEDHSGFGLPCLSNWD